MAGMFVGLLVLGMGAAVGALVGSYVLWVRGEAERYDLFWEEDTDE